MEERHFSKMLMKVQILPVLLLSSYLLQVRVLSLALWSRHSALLEWRNGRRNMMSGKDVYPSINQIPWHLRLHQR